MNILPYALPRNRSIEMMSTTISTNLNCNLACKHCYIQPDLLRRKEYIDEATFRREVEVIVEAFHLDQSVTYLHLDVLGGEATLMPFEFWERNLPWVLDRISDLNAAGTPTEFTFCSNLMWKDDRYLDLLRQFKGHPAMDIAIPFEGPESGRFGKNMAIFPKYLERIEALGECNMLNLVLVMGQGLIDLGPQYIIDTFVKRGISDVTCDMIFPWGSGRAYFDRAQPYYRDVARFIEDLTELGAPYGLTVDHLDDMRKSLRTLSRSQNTLNDAYEYHWDHRGELSLNPNQTGTEAVRPYINLNVWDRNAALKVVWGNNSELDAKLSYEHDFCRGCAYLQACNSGWYPHKQLSPEVLGKYMAAPEGEFSCPGFFQLWEKQAQTSFDQVGVTRYGNARRERRIRAIARAAAGEATAFFETKYVDDYEGYFDAVRSAVVVRVIPEMLFGCTVRQRLWFYDRLGKQVVFEGGLSRFGEEASIIAHSLAGNYHSLGIDDALIWDFVRRRPDHHLSGFILDAVQLARWMDLPIEVVGGFPRWNSGLEVSFKFEDLIMWGMTCAVPADIADSLDQRRDHFLTPDAYEYLSRIHLQAVSFSRKAHAAIRDWQITIERMTCV